MEQYITYLGFFSGFCTTFAFIPQLIKVWKTKSVKDISMRMFLIFFIGVLGWTIYGFLINDKPMIFANLSTLILAFGIIIGIYKFDN
ncbi:MAG: hypothetical protein CMM91_08455 [Rickettsiales bacterium]|nr:hypothetical protein [Rickettsiales bacterium]|tara:strand:- start:15980 stop:16240 length:261 start_codon:yes stop_codon:yes gene_type:complete